MLLHVMRFTLVYSESLSENEADPFLLLNSTRLRLKLG